MSTFTGSDLANHLYYNKLPSVYRNYDQEYTKKKDLYRYLHAVNEGAFNDTLEQAYSMTKLVDPLTCPEKWLPYLYYSWGLPYFEDIGVYYNRKFLSTIGEFIRRRGTMGGIRYIIRVLTGLECDLHYERETDGDVSIGRYMHILLKSKDLEKLKSIDFDSGIVNRFLELHIPYYFTSIDTSLIIIGREVILNCSGALTFNTIKGKEWEEVNSYTEFYMGLNSFGEVEYGSTITKSSMTEVLKTFKDSVLNGVLLLNGGKVSKEEKDLGYYVSSYSYEFPEEDNFNSNHYPISLNGSASKKVETKNYVSKWSEVEDYGTSSLNRVMVSTSNITTELTKEEKWRRFKDSVLTLNHIGNVTYTTEDIGVDVTVNERLFSSGFNCGKIIVKDYYVESSKSTSKTLFTGTSLNDLGTVSLNDVSKSVIESTETSKKEVIDKLLEGFTLNGLVTLNDCSHEDSTVVVHVPKYRKVSHNSDNITLNNVKSKVSTITTKHKDEDTIEKVFDPSKGTLLNDTSVSLGYLKVS